MNKINWRIIPGPKNRICDLQKARLYVLLSTNQASMENINEPRHEKTNVMHMWIAYMWK